MYHNLADDQQVVGFARQTLGQSRTPNIWMEDKLPYFSPLPLPIYSLTPACVI
jgi:hypothetical protein